MNPEVNHARFPVKFDNIYHILVLSLSTAKRHAREFKYLFIREGDKPNRQTISKKSADHINSDKIKLYKKCIYILMFVV
jgi:hypothetical protein